VKRDDVTGLGGGGNKLRKLEFLLGEALQQGADTIITVGARQSNHARLTAAVAARAGLKCELVLVRMVKRHDDDYLNNGNVILDELFGATIHDLPAGSDAVAFAAARIEALKQEGRTAYFCPLGGSSPVGCLGYAEGAAEIMRQAGDQKLDAIVLPNGSGGMHAGLVAGMAALTSSGLEMPRIVAHSVLGEAATTRENTWRKAQAAAALIDPSLHIEASAIEVDDAQIGEGYGIPTQGMLNAVRLMARQEGLLLDPVYGGKAFAGLLQAIEAGVYRPGQHVVFVITGGLPGIFAYRSAFDTESATV
jgi:D-cysteine desulfhydrase